MNPAPETLDLALAPFHRDDAPFIVSWVSNREALRLLSPSTEPPLTTGKLLCWSRVGGAAFVARPPSAKSPIAYGELNAVEGIVDRLWLGHVILRPDLRGRGLGTRFVRALMGHAFSVRRAAKVELIVFPENERAIDCYRRVGFRLVGAEVHHFREGGAAERMLRLELTHRQFAARTRTLRGQGDVEVPLELSGSTAMAAKTPLTNPSRICDTPL